MTGRMDRVRALLRTREELCALDDLYGRALSNGRNDISMLRSRGWRIDSWLIRHGEDAPFHKHYVLLAEGPRTGKQLALGLAS